MHIYTHTQTVYNLKRFCRLFGYVEPETKWRLIKLHPLLIRLLDCEPRWGLQSDLLGCDDFAVQFAKGQGSRYLVVRYGIEMSSVPMDRFW